MNDPDRTTTRSGEGSSAQGRLWSQLARLWSLAGPPLRPASEDVAVYQDFVDSWVGRHGAPRVLLLGVTPDLYGMSWPLGTDILALDRNQEMIDLIWPGPKANARCADWTESPMPDGSCDIVLCDGGLHLLPPDRQRRLVETLHDVLTPEGIVVLRLFARREGGEGPEDVLADLRAGSIPDVNALKLRLFLSLSPSHEEGLPMASVPARLDGAFPDRRTLLAVTGWPEESLEAVDVYRDSAARYHLPTREETEHLFCGTSLFDRSEFRDPPHAHGALTPIVCFHRA